VLDRVALVILIGVVDAFMAVVSLHGKALNDNSTCDYGLRWFDSARAAVSAHGWPFRRSASIVAGAWGI
jgi:hypothetical protein